MPFYLFALLPLNAQTSTSSYQPGVTPEGMVYFLPKTAVRIVVQVEKTTYTPGEFCKYADRYLRLKDVSSEPSVSYRMTNLRVEPVAMADTTKGFSVKFDPKSVAANIALSDDGVLLAINATPKPVDVMPAFRPAPKPADQDPRQLMSEEILAAGSTAKMAELTAQDIYEIRESRNLLIRGQADNMPKDGEQLKLMLNQLEMQDRTLSSLFSGQTVKDTTEKVMIIMADKEKGLVRLQKAKPDELYSSANDFLKDLINCKVIESGNSVFFNKGIEKEVHSELQPTFNKQFDLLKQSFSTYSQRGYSLYISVGSEQQRKRLEKIFNDSSSDFKYETIDFQLSKGFIDHDNHLLCYTDHEIFERYHKYTVRDMSQTREALTLKELFELKPGDYVTHIDYGVGRFSGLEKIETGGKQQEVIRLVYKNNDTLYISIHGLHKISRYVGKEGQPPVLNRLGSNTWQVLKQKTKRQVKDIAKDLIKLYAKRKATRGFAFSADSYLQHELEASFMYEDTPDQLKATIDVKSDMESHTPMDRLVCGDVGFGKTEVAIRAAFKAVCDSKQVAVLVPSTILAFQHYNTFCERLKGMPVNIDYLNRFRTTKERNQIIRDLESGKIDILIGTHAITNSKLKFKDLGLLIIDEEQKFGVSVKEKLKQMRANVDVLTLTATPIPRTLQFSLMGARDLSVIQTPPPNRQPIQTELSPFSEELIRDAIMYELSRDGQVFFISNRVENLPEMAGLVARLVPDASVAIAHGQMEGKEVEDTMMRFIEGEIDVLVATSIIENGLDIPNANTMIINNAQQFGLSDLHQMRGRVGRSNRKAFCYMLIPSYTVLTDEAQKRLRAIEEFATVGSGFNIAMRDLDIRGAGNILGAEQSGFISEIGYDMYHKILNEAIEELKESDFHDLFANQNDNTQSQQTQFVKECVIETDLEVLLPDDYVSNISERLQLYKELNDLVSEEELDGYRERLIDRFGPIPQATQELVKTITLRRMAKEFGIEKLVLKQGRMVCYFSSNKDNPFFKSENFNRLILYVQNHPRTVHMRETVDRLSLVCDNVDSIQSAIDKLTVLCGS